MKNEAHIHAIFLRKRVNGRLVVEPPIDRFMRYFQKDQQTGCWNWTQAVHYKGYGEFTISTGHKTKAHRFSYEHFRGPIPKGFTVDHLCRNRACVNPEHMEIVTNRENILRGIGGPAQNARKTHCLRGHVFDEENTYTQSFSGARGCRKCNRIYQREWARCKKSGIPYSAKTSFGRIAPTV